MLTHGRSVPVSRGAQPRRRGWSGAVHLIKNTIRNARERQVRILTIRPIEDDPDEAMRHPHARSAAGRSSTPSRQGEETRYSARTGSRDGGSRSTPERSATAPTWPAGRRLRPTRACAVRVAARGEGEKRRSRMRRGGSARPAQGGGPAPAAPPPHLHSNALMRGGAWPPHPSPARTVDAVRLCGLTACI